MTSRHLRILVVEDETLIRWSIAETLTREGHTVTEAASAAAAVKALQDETISTSYCSTTGSPIRTISAFWPAFAGCSRAVRLS
jgi:CheY-like chemotaxis protein